MASPKINNEPSVSKDNPNKSLSSTESNGNIPDIKKEVITNTECNDNSLGPSGDAPLNHHTKENGAFNSNTAEKLKDEPTTPDGDKTKGPEVNTDLGTGKSPDNVGGKQEFLVNDGNDESGQRLWKNCDFCKKQAKTLCRSCSFLYCPDCFGTLHPLKGPFAMHNIVTKSGFHDNETSICSQHGLAMKLRCTVCDVMRCLECATTVCALHFKSVFSRKEIRKEKEKMMTMLENTQRGVTMLTNRLELETERLETSTMVRRERIIQEFASFHALLCEKEAELLQALKKERDVKKVDVLDKLKEVIAQLEIEEAELSSDITAFVQDNDYENFSQKLSSAQNKFQTFEKSQKQFHATWVKCERSRSPTPLLDSHFSLYKEKEGLYRSLNQLLEGDGAMVTFKRKTLSMDVGDVISVGPLVDVSYLPPSTNVMFKFELLCQQKIVWQKETNNLETVSVDFPSLDLLTSPFVIIKRLVLRMTPKLIYQTGAISCQEEVLTPCHLMILQNLKNKVKKKEKWIRTQRR